jgi:hypothetical protein
MTGDDKGLIILRVPLPPENLSCISSSLRKVKKRNSFFILTQTSCDAGFIVLS